VHIDELKAKSAIEDAIKNSTDDYKLYIRKRVLKDYITKEVEFAIIIKPEVAEDIFNSLVSLKISSGGKISNISSGIMLHESERSIKDMIMVTALISTVG